MKKRILCILLTLCMLFSAVPMMGIVAGAATQVSEKDTSFVLPYEDTGISYGAVSEIGYVPIYAYWDDSSVDIPANATFTFQIEAVTDGAPLPEDTTLTLTAPTQKGVADKVGFSSTDTQNPWAITFKQYGEYEYRITQTTTDNKAFVCDKHTYSIKASVDSNTNPVVQFTSQRDEDVVLTAADFTVYKGNAITVMTVKEENHVTSITLGGGDNKAENKDESYNVGFAKSTYSFDFDKDFTIDGTMDIAAVPDGTVFGFIPNANPIGGTLNQGGCQGVYNDPQFANGLFVELDNFSNGTYSSDTDDDNITGIDYAHIDLIKTDAFGNPNKLTRLADVGNAANMKKYKSLHIENDASEKTLTVAINNEISYTYTYSDTEFENAYFVFGGCERFDTEYDLTSLNLVKDKATVTEIAITSINFTDDIKTQDDQIVFANIANKSYTLTADNPANGSFAFSTQKVYPGETVTLSLNPNAGYALLSYTVIKTGDASTTVSVDNGTFVMPDYDITVSAALHEHVWKYTVTDKTVSAVCTSGCPYTGTDTAVTLTVPGDLTYDGTSKQADFGTATTFLGGSLPEIALQYKATSDGAYADATDPTQAGFYKASFTVGKNENQKTVTTEYTVEKATPSVTSVPNAGAIDKDMPLSESTLTGGVADVTGTFAWKDGTVVPNLADTQAEYTVVFTPDDTQNYTATECQVKLSTEYKTVTLNANHYFAIHVTKAFVIKDGAFVDIAGTDIASNNGTVVSETYKQLATDTISFTVNKLEGCTFEEYAVYINGVRAKADENGVFTVSDANGSVSIVVKGSMDVDDDEELSFWESLYKIIRSIIQYIISWFGFSSDSQGSAGAQAVAK